MMSTRSGRTRQSIVETTPPRTRKGVSPTRSPGRNRRSSPTVSSTRKSPSRKSPSRKPAPKYPARKSPSRAVKETREVKDSKEVTEVLAPRSPAKRSFIKKDAEVRLEDVSSKIELLRSTRSRRIEYSVSDLPLSLESTDISSSNLGPIEKLNGTEEPDSGLSIKDIYGLRNRKTEDEFLPRRSSRIKEILDIPDIRRSTSKSLSKSISKSVSKSIDTHSDAELADELTYKEKSKSRSVSRKLATPLPSSVISNTSSRMNEFAGRLGVTVLYILLPLTVFYILISCSKLCSYIPYKNLLTYNTSQWFNTQASIIVIINFSLQAIFLSIPIFGTKEVDNYGRKYCFNALFSSLLTLGILFALGHYKVVNVDSLLRSYLQMATVSYCIAVILTLTMYLKSLQVDENDLNPYGNTGYLLYDFFMGREIQAYILNINVKLLLARVCNISTLIFSLLIFGHGFHLQEVEIDTMSLDELKKILSKIHFKPTILLYSIMQIIYALYFITREKKMVSTFYWQSEGLGYMQIVSSALYPYYFTTVSKYIADTGLTLTTNILITACALFLLGLIIMLISNNIKYEFRKNPLQPSLMHVDSMPTFHGKKLLVSNLWGVLRHPNYTGDILIHSALAIPGLVSKQFIPLLPAAITILMLLHRSWRDHGRCKRRYGAAWQRYCQRVPSVIVPELL